MIKIPYFVNKFNDEDKGTLITKKDIGSLSQNNNNTDRPIPSAMFEYSLGDAANSSIVFVENTSDAVNFYIPQTKLEEAFPDFPIGFPQKITKWVDKFLYTFTAIIVPADDFADGYAVQFTGFSRNLSDNASNGYPMTTVAEYGRITEYSYSPVIAFWGDRLYFSGDVGNGNFQLYPNMDSDSTAKKIVVSMVRVKWDDDNTEG